MTAVVLTTDLLGSRLAALTAWLAEWRAVWTGRAFMEQPVAWEADLPDLAGWLRDRSLDEIEAHEAAPHRHPDAPALLVCWAERSAALTALPSLGEPPPGVPAPRRLSTRKWAQIQSFAASVDRLEPASLIDWCAGKGHLGRTLGQTLGRRVHAVERDPHLCEVGQSLARRAGVEMAFTVADVLLDPLDELVLPGRSIVALHACGDLGTRALTLGAARNCAAIALSGCCFHRLSQPTYTPLSSGARALDFHLSRDQLRLPASAEVVASRRMRRLRRREMRFRLVVDYLLRQQSGVDRYRTLKSVPECWTNGSLPEFVAAISVRDSLGLSPTATDLRRAETWATERARVSRALGMTRAAFRRPLELWVTLDRALFLAEQGWSVRLGTFCPTTVTPRNTLILAGTSPRSASRSRSSDRPRPAR
ncbi:MAG: methyltransferase [Oligoflexia bacterium]|nr:methyltransferase [Oligoflexia bacterium]